jgi:predicted Rossmann fold nucleotide-binding protein DprA/Smf involved in DNA uptake
MEQKNDDNLKKQIENAAKQLTAADVFKSLDANQRWLVGWMTHTSLQKGRVLGQMEKEGKTAEDIAKRLGVPVEQIKIALNEKPEDVLVLMDNGGEDIVIKTEDSKLQSVEEGSGEESSTDSSETIDT